MNMHGALLTLCVLHPNVWGSSAFFLQAPKAFILKGPQTLNATPDFSNNVGVGNAMGVQPSSVFTEMSPNNSQLDTVDDSPGSVDSVSLSSKIWEQATPVKVQGGSLKTWSFESGAVQRVQIAMRSEGRPIDAEVELWQGPGNNPQTMRVYVEDGSVRPFSAVIETPRSPNTIAIRNTAHMEFPFSACLVADTLDLGPAGSLGVSDHSNGMNSQRTIQGGALKTYPFDPSVQSVQVLLKTDGRPLDARIELLQGPNNNKQVIELYSEDGLLRPFYAVLETPGSGTVVRILNTATMEFPLSAWVEPYLIGSDDELAVEPIMSGVTMGGPKTSFMNRY
eukprot:CAMPEP_0195514856 /NCGR_PEP_ID=MMETSP0794_2-20130614/6118_1 /TAXON_ID=515487 /ORGANISM="Stephanopyxis turris, Strain CCMP 815" /LENGTH=335 /DNA_ID=CAMNT_0040643185 /DNA_START=134 /DNA_END=1141 /DNA_ORIENTATION=-